MAKSEHLVSELSNVTVQSAVFSFPLRKGVQLLKEK